MRLLILGATGRTGRQLLDQALSLGHEVTAFARRPAALAAYGSRVRVIPGDITDRSTVAPAVAGQEAVLSALGVRTLRPSTVLSTGIGYTLDAMRAHRVRRLVCMSALGVGETRSQLGPVFNLVLIPLLLRHSFADKERLEAWIRASDTEWTIVRPGVLTNGPARGRYRTARPDVRPPPFPRISRADVAGFMLREVVERRFLSMAVGLWDEP
jgi:putative NADH-flavin reductase